MLKVDKTLISELDAAATALESTKQTEMPLKTLIAALHRAMKLEASTIPPYLVAAWSIQPSSPDFQNEEIRDLILSVAFEEMLHMMAVANIIAALGEPPKIATEEMVLDWGSEKLPLGGTLIPTLAPFSLNLLCDIFMEIEKPQNPMHYVVVQPESEAFTASEFGTIGEFYEAIKKLMNTFEPDPFLGGASNPQMKISDDIRMSVIGHAPIMDFEVKSRPQAIEILDWIVDQGEGSTEDPLDGEGEPAHYYRFAEIYKGGKLIEKPDEPLGYAYDQANQPIKCDFSKVRNFQPNPKIADFPQDSIHYRGLKAFNESYVRMFRQLQAVYDGDPITPASIDTMSTMSSFVDRLMQLTPPICPSFEWVEDN